MSSTIRIFLNNIIQVCLLAAVIVGGIFISIPPDPSHYFAGSLFQIELLEKTPGPRIILVGGSNIPFGLDAELMQRELGVSVINDGLHAGLGIAPLRELQQYIRKGDIIIVSLEYSMFSNRDGEMDGDSAFLSDWIEYSPSRLYYLSNPLTETPSIYVTMFQRKVNRKLEYYLHGGSLSESRRIFNSKNFNANGDFIGHLQEPSLAQKKIPSTPYPVFRSQNEIFVFLDDFNQLAREKGADVYFEAPASRQSNCKTTGEANIAKFYEEFENRSSIPLLTRLEDICIPDKYFFDTAYHLNADGRELRTKRLIKNLVETIPGYNN